MTDESPVKNRKTIEEDASKILLIFLASSTAGNMAFEHLTLDREIVEKSNANQAMITVAVPTLRYQGIPAPPIKYVLARKGSVSRPNVTAAVNQNFTHRVIPNTFFAFMTCSLITRNA